MALLDMFKRGAKRAGENLESYIGGLLGEDLSQLSAEERKQIRRQGMSAVFDAMARGTTPNQGLAGVAQMAGARLEQKRLQNRQQAAEQEMGRITGRLFGGAPAAPEDMGADESGLGPVAIRSQYRQDPSGALARMYGTAAGRDVAQMAPGLLKTAEEMAGPKDYIYQNVSGVGLVAVNKKDPSDMRIVQREVARTGGGAPRFDVIRGAQAESLGFPKGTVLQRNASTGEVKVLSAIPAAERTSLAGKERTVKRFDAIASRIESQLGKVSTGGPFGVVGAVSRVFDSQDAKLFESYRQQLSGAIRAALRIPGEGTLTDFEQRQYGLQLPDLGLSKESNLQVIESLKEQVRAASDLPAGSGEIPAGVSPEEWAAMTPAERALFE